jgi:tRNA(Ile)-lysidine synthase
VAALRTPPAVARVLERVVATARRHRMFAPGACVAVAVSGGADSLCLLHSLVRLRRLLRIQVTCFHFDHRLRHGSEADAAYVRRQAARLGVPFVLRTADSRPLKGSSVEAWARTVRYEALMAVAEERGAEAAVGHTADDQAETVLLALVRGGGLEAVAGMRAVNRPIVRPLLDVTRDETAAFCRAMHLRPREDPMNRDRRFMRAALRHHGIPALEKAVGRGVKDSLVRTAALLRDDADFLEVLADRAWLDVAEEAGGVIQLDAEALGAMPSALAGRVVKRALLRAGAVPEAGHINAVVGLSSARSGTAANLPGGLLARREKGYVRFSRASPEVRGSVGGPRRVAGQAADQGGRHGDRHRPPT